MYNYARAYAAAFSESYKKACDLLDHSAGGSGACYGNYGPRSATVRGRCPHSARVGSGNPPRGDTRGRSRNAGQPITGSRRVSPSGYVHRQIDSAKDERNLKPPLQGPQVKRLFPLRRQLQRNKVRPLNTDGPSLTPEARPPRPSARVDSARYAMFTASSQISNTNRGSGNLVVVGQSCKLTNINSDRTSSCPPVDDDDRPSSVVSGQARVPPRSRPKRPWTSRLRSLFAPRNRERMTTVQPFVTPQGQSEGQVSRPRSPKEDHSDPGQVSRPWSLKEDHSDPGKVSRPRSLKEDHSDPGHQSRYTSALMKNREAKGFGGNASTGTMYRRQGSAALATRPASCADQPLPIPGVPQLDWDHLQSSSLSALMSDNPILSQEQEEVTSLIVNYDDGSLLTLTPRDASLCNSSVSILPSFPSQRQEPAMEDGKPASDEEVEIPNPDPLTSISRGDDKSSEIKLTPQPSPMQDREGEDMTPDDNSVSKPVLQSLSTEGTCGSSDFTPCLCLEVQEQVQEDQDVAHNNAESTLKSVAPCSTATSEESPTNILICHLDRLQAEVVEDGDRASDLEGANSRHEPTSPSRNDAPSSPTTSTSSVMSSDENRTPDDGKPCTLNEVLISALPSLTSAIYEKEALERHGDERSDDEESPKQQTSASSSTRSSLSNPVKSFSMSPLSESTESTIKQDEDMVSENEGLILEPLLSSENDITPSIPMATSSLATSQHHNEVGEGGDDIDGLESISKPMSPSELSVSTASTSSSSSQSLGPGTEDEDFIYDDGREGSSLSSMRAAGTASEEFQTRKAKDIIRELNQMTSSTEDVESRNECVKSASPANPAKKPSDIEEARGTSSTSSQALEDALSPRQVASSKDSELSSSIIARKDSNECLEDLEGNAQKSDATSSTTAQARMDILSRQETASARDFESPSSVIARTDSTNLLNDLKGKAQGSESTPNTAAQVQTDSANLQGAASARDLVSSSSMVAKEGSNKNLVEIAGIEQKSDSDRQEPTPAGNHASSVSNLSEKNSTSTSPRAIVPSLEENQHSLQPNISKKSPSKDASADDKKSSIANASSAQTSQATEGPQDGIPELTPAAYPSIDPSELEFILSDKGGRVMLGCGNYGEVLLMRRQGDTTLLAVKVLTRSFSLLQQEVAAMHAVMNCPYFPKFVGVIDYCSYAQELVGGVGRNTAYNFSKARYDYNLLNALEWLHVCRDVTEGLKALHAAGWLHNDLHCGNAMVCPNPPGSEVAWCGKIIDLGNAQRTSNPGPLVILEYEEQNMFYKVAKQCAPEVLEGRGTFTEKSDIYSLGKLFVDVAGDANILHGLRLLGEFSCMRRSPGARPTLEAISLKLDHLIAQLLEAHQQSSSATPALPSSSSPSSNLRRHLS
ncbi:uncharacterized protein LOC119721590 [Patiria miniata]|uniref:non-specific serine/threonine protein kinase n=1 Tax=Patiria miniata TaxID=46514 RepID=A0A913Z796_PATMI|nr:uncharacterized protein LOC119721590 [Patiria miniata]